MTLWKISLKRIGILCAIILVLLYTALFFALRAPVTGAYGQNPWLDSPEPEKLREHVEFLSGLVPTRSVHHPQSLEKAAQYIIKKFEQMGYEVEIQAVPVQDLDTYNIIVKWYPESFNLASNFSWIVVGAHYDSQGKSNPGADDNASGVAGLLELARLFREKNPELKYPVQFVAYTTEEPPYFATKNMGSAIHAKSLMENKERVKLMLSLEMIGYFSDKWFSQKFNIQLLALFYPWKGNFIGLVGSAKEYQVVQELKKSFFAIPNLNTYSINAPPGLEGVDYSDHRSYWRYGWKAIMVTDTAFLRNEEYHEEGDKASRLNYDQMSLVVTGVFNSILNYSLESN